MAHTDPITREVLATCWTSAGDAAPLRGDERSPIDLRTRIEAAAAAGWEGFGLLHADLQAWLETRSLAELRDVLDSSGIRHVELEFLPFWWKTDARRRTSDVLRGLLLDTAEALGARTIKVGAELEGEPVDPHRFREDFDLLATQAAGAGTRVALEPMPMSNLSTIQAGVDFVREVGNPHGGLTIDTWHVARSGLAYADLGRILPIEHVFVVEIDDADAEVVGTLWEDTIDRRRLPGEGALDTAAFVRTLHDLGWRSHWGVEIISDEHRARPLDEALRVARDAALRTFDAAADSSAAVG